MTGLWRRKSSTRTKTIFTLFNVFNVFHFNLNVFTSMLATTIKTRIKMNIVKHNTTPVYCVCRVPAVRLWL